MRRRITPRALVATGIALALAGAALLPAAAAGATTPAQSASTSKQAADIEKIVQDLMEQDFVQATIVKITRGDTVILRKAYRESMTDVPATPKMNFRNGAVAFSYLGNLLLQYVDEKKVTLDDTIDEWMPDLPEADTVTLKMLANQTSGYPDFEQDQKFIDAFHADPFHIFTLQEKLDIAFSRPPLFPPGTNWAYAHTNFAILGAILSKIGGKPLDVLLREKVLDPLGLEHTVSTETSAIPDPALHTFSAERGLYEEATFWNTQWGTPDGANQTTTIDDMITTAQAIGTGKLLSKKSYKAMTEPDLLGFGETQPACAPVCFPQTEYYNFGLAVVRQGDWLLQPPLLSGIGSVEAYLPSGKVAIAVAVTLKPGFFTSGPEVPSNPAKAMFEQIGAYLAPDHAPPIRPGATS